ncbi:hypothetical protein B0H14DRAFT_2607875 [Mycena olivaceomarginata]|nr:hypothetical protein B0H14DRAFT_2607875 [Mycena olivaceomarginata]
MTRGSKDKIKKVVRGYSQCEGHTWVKWPPKSKELYTLSMLQKPAVYICGKLFTFFGDLSIFLQSLPSNPEFTILQKPTFDICGKLFTFFGVSQHLFKLHSRYGLQLLSSMASGSTGERSPNKATGFATPSSLASSSDLPTFPHSDGCVRREYHAAFYTEFKKPVLERNKDDVMIVHFPAIPWHGSIYSNPEPRLQLVLLFRTRPALRLVSV